jgi:HrpA-like RNA helicase
VKPSKKHCCISYDETIIQVTKDKFHEPISYDFPFINKRYRFDASINHVVITQGSKGSGKTTSILDILM